MNTQQQMVSIKRIPRPTGTTQLSMYYNKTNTIEDKDKLYEHIIQSYINTNFQYCNVPMNIEQFSMYIQTNPKEVTTQMFQASKVHYNLLTKEGQEDIFGATMVMLFGGALSDRSAALRHASILSAEMGNAYVPFLSSEVTKALANAQMTTNNMVNLVKAFFGNNVPNITINNTNAQQNNTNQLTVDEALKLIDSRATMPSLLEDPDTKNALFLEHNLSECPEVNATMQQGIDTSKEGLNFNKLTELKMVDLNAVEDSSLGHINRRAILEDVDLESDEV